MSEKNCAKKSNIGGQAVIEGVMMRGKKSMAIAVRDSDGCIRLETKRLQPPNSKLSKIPVLRGIVNFISTMVMGINTLMRSADVFGEAEPTKFEKWMAKKLKINLMTAVTVISLFLGIGLAIALFVLLPTFLTDMIYLLADISKDVQPILYSIIVGVFKIIILLCYLLTVSLIKDIKRTFMYHGAEHKTINCYESGQQLTVSNIQKHTTLHNRCGTTFLFYVIFISIIVFILLQSLISFSIIDNYLAQVGIRILAIPLVAGIAYELFKFLAKHDWKIFMPLKLPGLLLQKITTKEPDDQMVEVALTAFTAALEMDSDDSIKEVKFATAKKREDVEKTLADMFEKANISQPQANIDWTISHVLNIERNKIITVKTISAKDYQTIIALAKNRAKGEPLQYVLKETQFCGYKINLSQDVLIPRFETEIIAEEAIKRIKPQSSVLDLCTGSGCIAIAVQKKTGCKVSAADISEKAVKLAKSNAAANNAEIEFIVSDMFENLAGRKFDIIISNPPYIKSSDIDSLEREVKDYEPLSALDGGEDGLKYYKIIAQNAKNFINDGGIIFLETGYNQSEEVKELFSEYNNIEVIKDLDGNNRILKIGGERH
ncbi:MAG: peptide chain release factor N(5)-glutamine methyltransferase [Clostridia bacterium]|nr:peptide chain release factor N(5)-glutamine methyltransferase [Clostridia bacterium]